MVKEGTPELKKVRPDITQVVKKKTRGGIVGARSKTTPKTGKPVPLTSEFQVRDMLLYKGGGYPYWPVQVSLVHDDKLGILWNRRDWHHLEVGPIECSSLQRGEYPQTEA